MNTLWCEKYRPQKINDYVFSNPIQKKQIDKWIEERDIPHILLYGPAGVGKSSLAYVLTNEIEIDPYDFMYVNASRENSVDDMRNKITNFVSTMPYGKMKVVLLDEFDYSSVNSQAALRGIMEIYSSSSRFILTCNFPHKIIPAIHSRCQSLEINKMDIDDYTAKMAEILLTEKIDFDLDILDSYVKGCWPDLRKCINICQQNSIDGVLIKANSESSTSDYKITAIDLFKSGKIREARSLICKQIRPEEVEEFYIFLYNNLNLWGETDEQKDQAILIIRKGLVQIPMAADIEILVAATLIELSQLREN